MPTIDVQVHAYERNHPGRPWVGTLHGPAEVTGHQMVAAMDRSVSTAPCWSRRSRCTATTPAMRSKSTPRIPAIRLGQAGRSERSRVADTIAAWKATKGTVGIAYSCGTTSRPIRRSRPQPGPGRRGRGIRCRSTCCAGGASNRPGNCGAKPETRSW